MSNTVTLKHTLTGRVAEYPEHYLWHPVFGQYLVPTDEEAQCVDCVTPDPEPVAEPTPLEVFGETPTDFNTEEGL